MLFCAVIKINICLKNVYFCDVHKWQHFKMKYSLTRCCQEVQTSQLICFLSKHVNLCSEELAFKLAQHMVLLWIIICTFLIFVPLNYGEVSDHICCNVDFDCNVNKGRRLRNSDTYTVYL